MDVSIRAEQAGRRADNSEWMDRAVRVGLVSYGVVHLIIAWLAVRLALGNGGGSASSKGALQELAQTTAGRISLYVVAAGFLALVVWQVLEAIWGHRDEDGSKRLGKRLVSVGKAVVYGCLGFTALRTAIGSSSRGGGTHGITPKGVGRAPGPLLIRVVGVSILVVARAPVVRGGGGGVRPQLGAPGPAPWCSAAGARGSTPTWTPRARPARTARPTSPSARSATSARASRSRSSGCCSCTPRSPTTRRSPAGSTRRCTSCSSSRSVRRCWC